MGEQLRPEEITKAAIFGAIAPLPAIVTLVKEILEDMEEVTRMKGVPVAVYLHDEIATAEELIRLINDIKVHELTEEELADKG